MTLPIFLFSGNLFSGNLLCFLNISARILIKRYVPHTGSTQEKIGKKTQPQLLNFPTDFCEELYDFYRITIFETRNRRREIIRILSNQCQATWFVQSLKVSLEYTMLRIKIPLKFLGVFKILHHNVFLYFCATFKDPRECSTYSFGLCMGSLCEDNFKMKIVHSSHSS